MPDQLNKHLNKQKEFIHGLVELLKESLDDMPAELNQQGELTAGLVMLLKKSIASENTTKKDTSVTFWAEQFFSVILMRLL